MLLCFWRHPFAFHFLGTKVEMRGNQVLDVGFTWPQ